LQQIKYFYVYFASYSNTISPAFSRPFRLAGGLIVALPQK
jgi:hypothetical protein